MDKRTLLQLLLFSVVIITGCSKYEDEDYSCNKEVNQWAKSNLNEIKKMKVAEWYSINDVADKYKDTLNEYETVQYYRMFDEKRDNSVN